MRWLIAVLLLGGLATVSARPPEDAKNKGLPQPGHTPEQVTKQLGPPSRISRQVYQLRSQEQWHYGMPNPLRVVFDCPRGEKPRVVRVSKVAPR